MATAMTRIMPPTEIKNMSTISVRRAGLAVGGTLALFYLGCAFVMFTAPQTAVVRFFNSIMHGWNVEPIMRWDMPWWEGIIGALEIFVLGWLFGALAAVLYNIGGSSRPTSAGKG